MIGGCDPSGAHIGLATLQAQAGAAPADPPDLWLDTIRVHADPLVTDRRLRRALDDAACATHWAIERPPDKARRDANHGPQAPIGYAIGWWGGWVGRLVAPDARRILTPQPSEWRDRMLVWSARWGRPLPSGPERVLGRVHAPRGRNRPPDKVTRGADGTLVVHWAGCSHTWEAKSYSALLEQKPDRCQKCQNPGALPSRAEAIRNAWKETACAFVAAHWPEPYAELVRSIRARARTPKPDHRLEGVSDACEAVGLCTFLLG